MMLRDLCSALGYHLDPAETDVEITGVTHNSGWVEPGDLFVAVRGATADGHSFLPQALDRGAVAVMGEGLPDGVHCPIPYVTVSSGREALADAAAELAGHPSRAMRVIGVTGTDGKTTTSWIALHVLRGLGERTGFLSTIGYELPDGVLRQFQQHFTTPESPQVQELLATMRDDDAGLAIVEASSHALAMDRVRAVDWDVAIWTHLTREHLDFHGSVEAYFAEKRKLIERAPVAVLNLDDPWVEKLRGIAPREIAYSASGNSDADWWAEKVVDGLDGITAVVHSPLGTSRLELPMVGAFNVANALAALAAAAELTDAPLTELVAALSRIPGTPGRMQLVPATDLRVIVDFAHTPTALAKALQTLRGTTDGDLWVVIGSAGGKRDPGKHPLLGEAAAEFADHAVLTEDDSEDTPLPFLLSEMERGARGAAERSGRALNWTIIGDRPEAITYALTHARAGDTVLLAGKGPEDVLHRNDGDVPWNEVREAQRAIELRAARRTRGSTGSFDVIPPK